jgi:hypothetical protein
MKPAFLTALALCVVAPLACRPIASAAADVPTTTAVYRGSDTPVATTEVAYRPYGGYYRSYYRPYYGSYGYRPYYGYYRPYYRPYVYPYAYGNPYDSYVSPYAVGYRYPGAGYYYRRPGFYFGYRW